MTESEHIDKAALELVHELLSAPEGLAWVVVIRRKLKALAVALKEAQ